MGFLNVAHRNAVGKNIKATTTLKVLLKLLNKPYRLDVRAILIPTALPRATMDLPFRQY